MRIRTLPNGVPQRRCGSLSPHKQFDLSMDTSTSDISAKVARLTIKTGADGCYAYFCPALYQLTVVRDNVEKKIDLGFSSSRLLERLIQTPGEVVTREELMSHAWPGRVVGQGSLNQQIYTLRQALSDETARDIIQTLPRRGYQFNAHHLLEQPAALAEPPEQSVPYEVDTASTLSDPEEVSATERAKPLSDPTHIRGRIQRFLPVSFFALGLIAFAAAGMLYQCDPPVECSTADSLLHDSKAIR